MDSDTRRLVDSQIESMKLKSMIKIRQAEDQGFTLSEKRYCLGCGKIANIVCCDKGYKDLYKRLRCSNTT